MTTSPHQESRPWDSPPVDVVAFPDGESPVSGWEAEEALPDAAEFAQATEQDLDEPEPRARGTLYETSPGMPGRGVVLTTALATGACVLLDLALTGRVSIFFDLCFVVVCLVAAMGVRPHDLFTAGVMPPLAFAAVMGALTMTDAASIGASGGFSTVFLTGLASHAGALVAGYAVALLTVAARVTARRVTSPPLP